MIKVEIVKVGDNKARRVEATGSIADFKNDIRSIGVSINEMLIETEMEVDMIQGIKDRLREAFSDGLDMTVKEEEELESKVDREDVISFFSDPENVRDFVDWLKEGCK